MSVLKPTELCTLKKNELYGMLTISQLKSKTNDGFLKKTHYLNNSKARITNEVLYATEE